MVFRFFIILFVAALALSMNAQEEYINPIDSREREAIEIYLKKRYWNSNTNQQKYIRNLTEVQQSADAVILHKELLREYFRNSKNFLRSVSGEHTVIKILSEKGLKENLIFLFEDIKSNHSISFEGLKIVKPDGREIEIDIDAIAQINTKGNVTQKKIVVPNLEVGDVIDYYTYLEFRVIFLKQYSRIYDPVYILPNTDYPIVDYDLIFSLGPSAFMNVSTNKIPEFKKVAFKVDKRTFTRYSLHLDDLETYPKNTQWCYPFRALPSLKYQIFVGPYYGNTDIKYNLGGSAKLNSSIQHAKLQDYMMEIIGAAEDKPFYKGFKQYLKAQQISAKQTDDATLVNHLYYYNRFKQSVTYLKTGNWLQSDYKFSQQMHYVLSRLKIEHQFVLAFDRKLSNADNFILMDEIEMMLEVNVGDKIIYWASPNQYTLSNTIPIEFDGVDVYRFQPETMKLSKDVLPKSSADDNVVRYDYALKMKENNLIVERSISAEGYEKFQFQAQLEDEKDLLYDQSTGVDWQQFVKKKERKEILNLLKPTNETKDLLLNGHNDELKQYSRSELVLGNTSNQSVFNVEESYILSEVVQERNENLFFALNTVYDEFYDIANNRLYDIYLPYPTTTKYSFKIATPAGYQLGEVSQLNKLVDNDVGLFSVEANESNNFLIITIEMKINYNFIVKEDWNSLKEILEAANDFGSKSLIYRKQ